MVPRSVLRLVAAFAVAFAVLTGSGGARAGSGGCGDDWLVQPTLSPGDILNSLNGVAVVSPTEAWAVGFEGSVENFEFVNDPVIERWNGSRWSLVRLSIGHGQLADVEAVAADDVWAVGQSGQEDEATPLALHWNGTSWKETSPPFVERGYLLDVSATASYDVWAVGIVTGTFETLVAHWNGAAWSYLDHPSPVSDFVNLGSVLARGPADVWIAGNAQRGETKQVPFSEHWDGKRWTVVPMPNAGAQGASIDDLAASRDGLWAMGHLRIDDFTTRTLTQRWNGRAWEIVESPTPGSSGQLLGAVAAGPHVWAVGSFSDVGSDARTLTMRYGAHGWKVVPSPNVGALGNMVLDADAGPDDELWAVGFFQRPGRNHTLAMHRCDR
jgi:hypothetical protein